MAERAPKRPREAGRVLIPGPERNLDDGERGVAELPRRPLQQDATTEVGGPLPDRRLNQAIQVEPGQLQGPRRVLGWKSSSSVAAISLRY